MTRLIISILGAVINNAAMNIHGKIFMDIHFYLKAPKRKIPQQEKTPAIKMGGPALSLVPS